MFVYNYLRKELVSLVGKSENKGKKEIEEEREKQRKFLKDANAERFVYKFRFENEIHAGLVARPNASIPVPEEPTRTLIELQSYNFWRFLQSPNAILYILDIQTNASMRLKLTIDPSLLLE